MAVMALMEVMGVMALGSFSSLGKGIVNNVQVQQKIDIIFSDPPYSKTDVNEVAINNLIKNNWLNDKVYIFLETSSRMPIKSISGFEVLEKRKIGDSLLTIYLSSSY